MRQALFSIVAALSILTAASQARCQWVQDPIQNQNAVVCFAQSGTNLFAGSDAGIVVSNDNGVTWSPADNGLINPNVVSLAVIQGSKTTNLFAALYNVGIYRSTDTGNSWSAASTELPTKHIRWLLASTDSSGNRNTDLFAATYDAGVFRSTDTGKTWTAINSGLTNDTIITLAVVPGDAAGTRKTVLFAGTVVGAFRSMDNGNTWTNTSTGLTYPYVSAFAVIPANTNGNPNTDLFIGTSHVEYLGIVFRSTDNGDNWSQAMNGFPTSDILSFAVVPGDASTNGATRLFGGTSSGKILVTSNNADNWTDVTQGYKDPSIQAMSVYALFASGQKLFAGAYQGGIWHRPLSEMIPVAAVANTVQVANSLVAFPNPATQSTTIGVTLQESGQAEITIVNLLGEEVARLFSGTLAAGPHTFTWSGQEAQAGVYECIAHVGASVVRTRVVILR